jgi:hypothetical protein
LCVGAEVAAAGETVAAVSANDVAFSTDDFSGRKTSDVRADGGDFTYEFVADDQRSFYGGLGPWVPVADVEVCAADAGFEDADEDVVDAGFGDGDIFEPEAGFGAGFD